MDTEPRPARTAHGQKPKFGVCERVRVGIPLTQEDLNQAEAELPHVRQANAESNGLFVGCTLCGHTCQLVVDETLQRDEFCETAIAERDAAGAPPVAIPKPANPVD